MESQVPQPMRASSDAERAGSQGPAASGRDILLIGGMPRSGTTLLSSLVQREFNIPVAPETHFFDKAVAHGLQGLPKEVTGDAPVIAAYATLTPEMMADPIAAFRLLLDRLLPDVPGTIAEKTPDHLMHFDFLLSRTPDIRTIVIVRACEEVCNSLVNMPWNYHRVRGNLRLWVIYYVQAWKLRRKFPGRVAVVGYERLCADPDGALKRIAAELKLGPNWALDREGGNFDVSLEPWKQGSDGPVRPVRASGTPHLGRSGRLAAIAADRLLRRVLPLPGLR